MSAVRNACVITTALMSCLLFSGCRRAASPAGKYEINAADGKVMSAVVPTEKSIRPGQSPGITTRRVACSSPCGFEAVFRSFWRGTSCIDGVGVWCGRTLSGSEEEDLVTPVRLKPRP